MPSRDRVWYWVLQKDMRSYYVNQKKIYNGEECVVGKVWIFTLSQKQRGIREYEVQAETSENQEKTMKAIYF